MNSLEDGVLHIEKARRMPLFVGVVGIAAAIFLLDNNVPVRLRVLPWLLVFGYPIGRMVRAGRKPGG